MRVLNLAGGAFKGAYQVPIATALCAANKYDLILGTSVGAINGAVLATKQPELLHSIWTGLDDRDPWGGVKGFLKPLWWKIPLPGKPPDGLFTLEPMRAMLERHVRPQSFQTPYGCGYVVRNTGAYRVVHFDETAKASELHDAIMASSAMSGIMEAIRVGDEDRVDGGHRNVLARMPKGVKEVDAVFCTELAPLEKPRCERGALNAILWGIESALHNTALEDLEDLRELARSGVKVRVWAPKVSLGGMLDASAEMIGTRMQLGTQDLGKPLTLK